MNNNFPRTEIGGLSISRMIIGTNNVMGGSHRTFARDTHIKGIFEDNKNAVADFIIYFILYLQVFV